MKKVVLVIAAMGYMVVAGSVFAQDQEPRAEKKECTEKSPVEKAEKRTEHMKEELNLSDAQAEEIRQINLYHIQEMEEIRQKMRALKKEAHAKREAHKAKIDEVLTEEQRQLYEEKMAERRKKHHERKKQCNHDHRSAE